MRRIVLASAATALAAVAGFSVSSLISGGAAAPEPRITICHHTGSQTNPTVTITINENAWPAHEAHGDTRGACPGGSEPRITICHRTGSDTNPMVTITINESAWPAHEAHGDTRGACPGSTTTTTTTTTTPTPPQPAIPPVTGTAGLSCRHADGVGPFLRLNVVAAGDSSTTIGMEKDVLACSGASTQTRDIETFIELVQRATPTGLDDVALRVHTALCVKDFHVGRVQCTRRSVDVGGTMTTPLYGCRTSAVQPADPVSMLSKGVGNWFKTTKLEKEIVACSNGLVGDLYLFTDVLSANPPTAAASQTSFRGIVCWWDPSDGVPPQKCNPVKTT